MDHIIELSNNRNVKIKFKNGTEINIYSKDFDNFINFNFGNSEVFLTPIASNSFRIALMKNNEKEEIQDCLKEFNNEMKEINIVDKSNEIFKFNDDFALSNELGKEILNYDINNKNKYEKALNDLEDIENILEKHIGKENNKKGSD